MEMKTITKMIPPPTPKKLETNPKTSPVSRTSDDAALVESGYVHRRPFLAAAAAHDIDEEVGEQRAVQ
jgi:hypothetical protein